MSGGVDSATAAAILARNGLSLTGVTMQLWDDGSHCVSRQHMEDAKKVADLLGIPHHVLDVHEEFRREVLDPSVEQYKNGRTPNPCVVCNQRVKMRTLLRYASEQQIQYVATGHYARTEYDGSRQRFLLKRGEDQEKDQSYWLAMLSQEALSRILLPLGSYSKTEVRELALEFGLSPAHKRESQDVCWLGNFQGFVRMHLEPRPGPIVDNHGTVVGEHRGVQFYTVGQRKGLRIASSAPLYVVRIDGDRNILFVGEQRELYGTGFRASQPNWIGIQSLMSPLEVDVKIRYRGAASKALIRRNGDGVSVQFFEPQRAITPGQLAVFYRDDEVIGSAWIDTIAR
ncbi:hypothetical protein AMJ40_02860 [candidate division TA06 bacterium DG_26]|uniref:tRNA-specific 2-thiouridylase MnmA n=1 Tax=candidate division TA06 bacterium DG_26 TaxID=1703771 RepID=A0A0S7WK64_UNCT6|nr:MAG: hypothetical protein AMJ40_02860 [candidate division TA06 bacterium DG_26]